MTLKTLAKLDDYHYRISDQQAKELGGAAVPKEGFRRWVHVGRSQYGWLLRRPCADLKRGWCWAVALPRGQAA